MITLDHSVLEIEALETSKEDEWCDHEVDLCYLRCHGLLNALLTKNEKTGRRYCAKISSACPVIKYNQSLKETRHDGHE